MMATARNPARDAVAFVGVGTTPYLRDAGGKSATALACDAARTAIEDAGVDLADIDGICGSSVPTVSVQAALGLPAVTWWSNSSLPFSLLVIEAMNAVFSGACTTVLVYHSSLRGAGGSKTAAADPFRVHNASDAHGHNAAMTAESPSGTYGYCAWASAISTPTASGATPSVWWRSTGEPTRRAIRTPSSASRSAWSSTSVPG